MKTWEINGLSLTLDLDDYECAARYEAAFEAMSEEESVPVEGKLSERIQSYCELFRRLFDRIFGDGTSDKLFEGIPTSCSAYDEVYLSFLDFVGRQISENARDRAARLAKYSPKK